MLVEILPKLQKLEALRFDYFGMHDPRPSGEILDAASSLPRLRILDLVPLPKFDVSEIQKGPGSVVLRTIGRFGNLSIGNSSAGVLSTARQLSRRLDLTSPFATGPPSSFKGEKGGPEWKVTGIPSDALEDSMFPDLEHLCVRGVISDFQGLLSYTGPFPSMSQLKLDIRNIEDANSFFCIITSSFSADTLTELKVILDGPPRVMGSRKLNQEVFAPLAAFSRLSKLTIRCSDTFSLSGQAVIHISKSWPMLRALSIDGQGSGHINFNDLEILLANCALLEFMHIPLLSEGSPIASSSSVLVNSSPLAPSSVRSERVMRLELYGSLIEDPQSTAARLAGMLPRLQFISCSGGFSTRLFAKKSWDKLKVSWLETENCLRELISERERF
ncbi:hypothetical protein CONPUDRAFT_164438 [Coniophora puteana RWD-64-598 SS2]|uniref:RNI-like protein n=1 Tax=Coniophora puteana (strain RWD-64-598) TaxID=741705 RepID=A0A5M3MY03_CONPW|nr:uncharacterized protein CONPUDRAFT_164438 [Coniophora puteana RWD-64-598 SS2]EIW83511.1 hypothetical protein CONPUDRAFT_164438 [Coniophora puteana RWD-64-598 SS2]